MDLRREGCAIGLGPFPAPRMIADETPDLRQHLLAPIGHLYGWIVEARFRRHRPYRSRVPVDATQDGTCFDSVPVARFERNPKGRCRFVTGAGRKPCDQR